MRRSEPGTAGGWRRFLLAGAILLAIAGFIGLGVWQLQRRAWKLDLIAQVEARLAAAPVEAPGPAAWPALSASDAYTRVQATGRFLHDRESAVLAVTDLGSGYWILTPLETPDFTLLVNRGFVPPERRDPASRPEGQVPGEVAVAGLLRLDRARGRVSPRQRSRPPTAGIRATSPPSPPPAASGRSRRISSTPTLRRIRAGSRSAD